METTGTHLGTTETKLGTTGTHAKVPSVHWIPWILIIWHYHGVLMAAPKNRGFAIGNFHKSCDKRKKVKL